MLIELYEEEREEEESQTTERIMQSTFSEMSVLNGGVVGIPLYSVLLMRWRSKVLSTVLYI